MVQVSRWHNFSPAMKNHRAPQGLKEKEEEGEKKGKKKKKTLSKLVLALSLVYLLKLYHQQTRTWEVLERPMNNLTV